MTKKATKKELAWLRTVYYAGFDAGKRDTREHPFASDDPWKGGYGAREEIAFQFWLTGMLPNAKIQ